MDVFSVLGIVAGFLLLIKGADYLIDGASAIAKKLKISDLVIGLTIVAFGTSAPELIVNIFASMQDNTEIAIGNIVGSNIANIFLILGAASIVYPLTVTKSTVWKEIPLSLLAAVVLMVMANDRLIDGADYSGLKRIDGLILLIFFSVFLYYTYGVAKKGDIENKTEENNDEKTMGTARSLFLVAAGLMGLMIGGKFVVDGAVVLARNFGVSEMLIGLTIVAVGTSLPELVTSVMAALKKNSDIAVGNAVGSNIFNIFLVLGVSSVIKPLPFQEKGNVDLFVMVFSGFLLFLALFVGKKHLLERWQGVSFIFLYIIYIIFLVYRG